MLSENAGSLDRVCERCGDETMGNGSVCEACDSDGSSIEEVGRILCDECGKDTFGNGCLCKECDTNNEMCEQCGDWDCDDEFWPTDYVRDNDYLD